jgi:ribosomal protein S18 acetylase RimI-like enzyme
MEALNYCKEDTLDPQEFTDLLIRSGLDARRPVNDQDRISAMCRYANLVVTARLNGKMVGVARSLSDFSFCTYLSDLAVDKDLQHQGIGVRLIAETKKHSPQAKLILLAAPAAIHYYPKIGMQQHTFCYFIDNIEELKLGT